MSTLSDAWFASKAQMNDEEPATPKEVQALKDFLNGIVSAPIAAKQIMTMNEDRIPFKDKLDRVSSLIFDAAMHFQAQQPSLIELLNALNHLSEKDLDLTESQKAQYSQMAAWEFLDSFIDFMDEFRRSFWAWRCSPDEEDDDPRDCYRRWASINAFQAHFFVHDKGPLEILMYCMEIIRVALEQEPWKHPPNRPIIDIEKPRFEITILDAEVPAAAQWLLIAGRMIYDSVDKEQSPGFMSSSDLWQDNESGLTKKRWALWKQRLRWIQQHDALNEDTRMLAADALNKMDKIESGSDNIG